MDADLMLYAEEQTLVEVGSETTEHEPNPMVLSGNIMEVLYPAAMPPQPKNARMIRRFGFH